MIRKKENKSILKFDMINRSITRDFTQIPNDLLRNPNISAKAKTIQCILLSNKQGWKSYLSNLCKLMKEGQTAIRVGIKELQQYGYIFKARYQDKYTKRIQGTIWVYTDIPNQFDGIDKIFNELENNGLCFYSLDLKNNNGFGNPDCGNPNQEKPNQEKRTLIIHNNNNNKYNNTKQPSADVGGINGNNVDHLLPTKTIEPIKPIEPKRKKYPKYIRPQDFDRWWVHYPRKAQKGKAKTAWNKLCSKRPKTDTPSLPQIVKATKKQKKTNQWIKSNGIYIPYPSTYLNNMRWLDDIDEMNKEYKYNQSNQNNSNQKQNLHAPNAVIADDNKYSDTPDAIMNEEGEMEYKGIDY